MSENYLIFRRTFLFLLLSYSIMGIAKAYGDEAWPPVNSISVIANYTTIPITGYNSAAGSFIINPNTRFNNTGNYFLSHNQYILANIDNTPSIYKLGCNYYENGIVTSATKYNPKLTMNALCYPTLPDGEFVQYYFGIEIWDAAPPASDWPTVDMKNIYQNSEPSGIFNTTPFAIYLYNDKYGASLVPPYQNSDPNYQLVSHNQQVNISTGFGMQYFIIGCNLMEDGIVSTKITPIHYHFGQLYNQFYCSVNANTNIAQYQLWVSPGTNGFIPNPTP